MIKVMIELNGIRLVKNHLVTDRISLYIGYSRDDGGGISGGQMKLTVRTNSLMILITCIIIKFKKSNYDLK